MIIQLSSLSDLLLDQFIEDDEVKKPTVLRVTLWLHWIILKGYNLGKEMLVVHSQPLLLLEDVLAVEGYPFPFVI